MSVLDSFKKLFGDPASDFIKKSKKTVSEINDFEPKFETLTDDELKHKTIEFKQGLADGSVSLDDILPEAFAVIREASKRVLGMRHYDVQMIGGMVIHSGAIAEMRTGEGKTLVATLPAYLNALVGKGVHVVTVNDYLARRDAVWMGQVYHFLGLSVSVINQQNTSYRYTEKDTTEEQDENRDSVGSFKVSYDFLESCSRKEAYQADIVYGTNNEFGFDYLRDNLAVHPSGIVQRGHFFAIVDEIDSILIDEARTPLIISQPGDESTDLYKTFAAIAETLVNETDFRVDEKLRAVTLTDSGIEKAEKALGVENIYTEKGIAYVHHLETAVRAQSLFKKDKEYVVSNGEVLIVDPSTGRMMPGRRFNMGLHQALEAKEGVVIQQESKTAASITYQNYFKFYERLSGMTGTAKTSSEEFLAVYGLDVITIPTHKTIARIDHQDLIFINTQAKFRAIAQKIKEINATGQPVLVGTISIEQNELLSEYLKSLGVKHQVLNAKKHEEEGQVIAQAGKKGAVVIATNMAGRGIDIKLGGDPCTSEEEEEIKKLGGLFVLGSERHDSRRIDNQLRGRAGRQGDPGETQFFVSLDDDLARIFGGDRLKSMIERLNLPEDEPISNKFISRSVESAQKKVEGFQFDGRKSTLEYDNVLNTQRNTIYTRRRTVLLSSNEEVEAYVKTLGFTDSEYDTFCIQKIQELGADIFWDTVRRIVLHVTDTLWMQHLDSMAHLKNSVNLRSYGQRDPIIEYKREGLQMFKTMELEAVNQIKGFITTIRPEEASSAPTEPVLSRAQAQSFKINMSSNNNTQSSQKFSAKEYGRNDKVILVKGGEEKEIKFKKAQEYLDDGWVIKK